MNKIINISIYFAAIAGLAGLAVSYWLMRQKANRRSKQLKEAGQKLAEADDSYDKLLAEMNDGVVIVDHAGKIIKANNAFVGLLGPAEGELSGHFLPDLAPPTEKKRMVELVARTLEEGRITVDDLMLNNDEGDSFWFDAKASTLSNQDDTHVQVVLKDITERKRQYILTEKEISFLHELSRTLPLTQDFDQMLDRILGLLCETLPFHGFALILAEPDDAIATICVSDKVEEGFLADIQGCVTDVISELGGNIDPSSVEYIIERKTNIETARSQSVGSQILLPLAVVNGIAGLFSSEESAFKKEDLSLFSTMVSGISSLYIAYKSYQKVQALSETDSLTGLANRRKFFAELHREIERVSRYDSPLTLIMLDIDHFKKINDSYGHQMGDEVLRTLSEILLENTRKTDIVARYGGEEFIIMLTETALEGASGVANRIKTAIEKATVLGAGIDVKFTASLGLTDYQLQDTVDTIVARTDAALFTAKRNGRNRVELCGTKEPAK